MRSRLKRLFKRAVERSSGGRQVDEETVTWAYRLFLDRETNAEEARQTATQFRNTAELRAYFTSSAEFRDKSAGLYAPALTGIEPALDIDYDPPESDLQALFHHVQTTWQKLGEEAPHWSVISAERFRPENFEANKDVFFASGKRDTDRILNTLARNGIDRAKLKSCAEYGCGVGRVTQWLAGEFETVYGCDISRSHLGLARESLDAAGKANVQLVHIRTIEDIKALPKVDLVYSVIVLQHNPPPIIRLIVESFMRALNPGGVALFQVPTYRAGYQFSMQQYLRDGLTSEHIEMHVLPQRVVMEVIRQNGGEIIEVIEDGWVGFRPGEMSNTFLAQKTAV